MPILVTGAAGFIGSHVVDLLVEEGETARALVRPNENVDRLMSQGVDICLGDMKDRDSLAAAVTGMDRVIHCAARTGPWGSKEEYEAVNVRGLKDLLDLSLAAGVKRFVHVSSIIVMGADVCGAADETRQLHIEPHNPYSWSKVMSEQLVEEYIQERDAPVTIVRPGWVYGPRDIGSFARFASMIQKRKMIVMGSGRNHVPLVYVADVARGILLAYETDQAIGKVYILINDELVTQQEYLDAISAELRMPRPKIHLPYQLGLTIGSTAETTFRLIHRQQPPPLTRYGVQLLGGENRLSIQKARGELRFTPQINLSEGVRQSVAWFLKNSNGKRLGG